jgi:hypothetical protein
VLSPFKEDRDDLVVIEESSPPSELKRINGVRPRKPVNVDRLLQQLRQDR